MIPLRLVHVLAPGPLAGAERAVIEGARALLEAGHDLRLLLLADTRVPEVTRQFIEAAERAGLGPRPIRTEGRLDPRAVIALRRASQGAAVVHVHGYKALVHALLTGLRPILATHHGETAHDRQARLYEGLARRLYRATAGVIAVSEAMARDLKAGGLTRTPIHLVPNFTRPLDLGSPPPRPDARTHLVFLGRLAPEKNLGALLEALDTVPEVRLTVYGEGPERVGLEAAVRRLGLGPRVTLRGFVEDIGAALRTADALVLPSLREGLPLAVLEAALAGLPVVASAVGGVPEVITDGENGLLVPAGEVDALRRAVVQLHGDRDGFRTRAVAAIPRLRARFGPETWAARTLRVYRSVAG